MPALSYYSNVHNTALVILQQKGYRVWTEDAQQRYCAEKDGWDFMADDPVQLLGLVAIHDFHRPADFAEYWWRLREPWLLDALPDHKPDFTPIWQRR